MELSKVTETRRSVREYINKPVETEKLREMIAAAQLAPSWKNSQVSRYYVVTGEKLALAEYLMIDEAYNWWKSKNARNVTQDRFQELFFEKFFPRTVHDQMLSQLLSLKQGYKNVTEYKAEFSRLTRYAPEGIYDNEEIKMQKFKDGLYPKILHNV